MKVIIAGSRGVTDPMALVTALSMSKFTITEVVCGGARGADSLGEVWGQLKFVPVKMFPPDWKLYGKAAGYIRNHQMGDYAEALIALWDGKSKGTLDMISYTLKLHKPIFVYNTTTHTGQLRTAGDHLITLCRGTIGKAQGVDITAKSAQGNATIFAPPWELVRGHQDRSITNAQYTRRYRLLLDTIPMSAWRWLFTQAFDNVLTVLCYCPDTTVDGAPKFCHTHVLVEYVMGRWPAYFHDGRNPP